MRYLTLYGVLGVPPSASDKEIREHYLDLAIKNHPDHGGDKAKFQEITHAHAVLKDKDRRSKYDAYISIKGKPCTHCEGRGTKDETVGFTKKIRIECPTCDGTGQAHL